VVLSYQKQTLEGFQTPYIFRTYKNLHHSADPDERLLDRNPGLAHDIPIWQVARATSAAPTYFKPMEIDGLEYLDGGFGANNPCAEIYDEVRQMNNNSNHCVSVVVSVGTGKNKNNRFGGSGLLRYLNYIDFARKWASDSEKTDDDMRKKQMDADHKFNYVRLNVPSGLEVMKLDEWRARGRLRTTIGKGIGAIRRTKQHRMAAQNSKKTVEEVVELTDDLEDKIALRIAKYFQPRNKTLESIRFHTETYLDNPRVKDKIAEVAQFLVDSRRLRAKRDPERWEKTCYGAWYQ